MQEIVLRTNIGNVESAVLSRPAGPWRIDTNLETANWHRTEMGPHNQNGPLTESQQHVINPTNPGRAFDNRIEHRLHVRWRTADDTKHL